MAEFKELVSLSKAFKIFLSVLSIVAVAGLIGTFALMSWADDKVERANLSFNGVDRGNTSTKADENAYKARVHFERLDFLLRSKVIAFIDITNISWDSAIKADAINNIKSQNRHLKFTTTQNLQALNTENLGQMSYKMDFSPLVKTIVKYYFVITFLCLFANFLYRLIYLTENGKITLSLNQTPLPQALWQGYKAINPLYRHTFWVVFIACNVVFGFHTVQFLWGFEDWMHGLSNEHNALMTASQGRYTQNIISMFIEGGNTLPILNNLLSFAALSLASVWLCIYLNIQKKLYIWVIVGFVLTLQPFTLARMYYTYQVAGLFIAVAIGILGFVLAKKAGEMSANALVTNMGGGGRLSQMKG